MESSYIDQETGVHVAIDPRTGRIGPNSLMLMVQKREQLRRDRVWWRRWILDLSA